MLPEKAIYEFRELYRKEFGIILTLEEAKNPSSKFYLFIKTILEEISNQDKNTNFNLKGGE
jgi:hypothetical protein